MSDKWLQREGLTWVEKQIITHEQLEEILKLYPASPQRITRILPALASILVGLGVLTFVASNWDGMPHLVRLGILMLTMISFYASGFFSYRKGHLWVGLGLLGLGVITFGASMILIGQMFHLIAYDARVFVLWSLAGLGILYLYRHKFFFFLCGTLLLAGQIYAMFTFGEASWVLFALTLLVFGVFAYAAQEALIGWVMAFLLGVQSVLLVIGEDIAWSWVTIVPIGLYAAGLWLGDRPVAEGFRAWPPTFTFAFATLMVFIHGHVIKETSFLAEPLPYFIVFGLLLILVIWKSGRETGKLFNLILYFPYFYFSHGDIYYLAAMFLYASFLIYWGDLQRDRWQSNIGVFLFMLSSFVGYIQLAWDFLDKSLFFLIGGLILFTIHWILRRRSHWLGRGDE